ncbi:ABC transporter substrate-binding protein [Actinophytocola algeriensis]|uniref:Peptide/nickel transport system substrate-binding protein n=1 Tax=Actinophytocola algeriensis TaxID=1768010 RepID=A0A7W7VDB5_9PSEU|nr:ABC transporter substrate-binding protein [Actinophytocola algeriensis]MBB4906001.1 peptide/nickel transport system substrate-binding protein [Actinophytocola algeriensis]MBE1472314.1 peptide/nickel transport system substrate-binding protein [Actinophytocola algeriensis]
MRSLRHAAIAVTALVGLVATTACGADAADGGGDASGGEIAVAGQFPTESIDPNGTLAIDGGTRVASMQLYSPLLETIGPGEFDPKAAESWEINDTATEFTFTLRDGITFSDGSPITGQDVAASFERTVAAKSPFSANFVDVGVTATDDTVTFTPAEPDPALPAKLTGVMITPADATEDSYLDKPVTSGPFKVESFTPGGDLVMVPNDKYWGDKPKLDRLTIRSIPEVAARVTALETGELDVIWGISDDQVTQLNGNSEVKVVSATGSAVITMWMNASTPALGKAEVRRALWQAVDFDKKIKALYPESGEPADSVVGPTVFGYAPQEPVAYDPDAAKQALADAGFDFDTTLRFHFSQAQFRQWVDSVVSDLAAIGVKAEALEKEQAVYTEDLLALNWDINIQQVGTLGLDASYNLGRLYTCAAERTGYCNPELDTILKRAGTSVDPEERKAAYADATELIWNEAVGMFPMFAKNLFATRASVSGFEPDGEGLPRFDSVSIDE